MVNLQTVYDQLWRESADAFERGEPRLDAFLTDRAGDRRRAVTLVARPDAAVCAQVQRFLDQAAAVAPEQYFYQPAEFHLTVLPVIPGSASWQNEMPRLPDFLGVLDEILAIRPAFSVTFRGVTASPEAMLIQGFPADDRLPRLRDDLRAALTGRGLGENLDRRYRLITAHLTVLRFFRPRQDWRPFAALLKANRDHEFGTVCFRELELIEADWYASADSVKTWRRYPLAPAH